MGEQWLLFVNFEEKLKAEFPEFYSNIYFECGPGWYEILRDLSLKIREHLQTGIHEEEFWESPFSVTQVKEKYGELRFYVASCCSHIHEMIEKSSKLSRITCENCGNPGTMRTFNKNPSGWVYTNCDRCWEKMESKNKSFLEMK